MSIIHHSCTESVASLSPRPPGIEYFSPYTIISLPCLGPADGLDVWSQLPLHQAEGDSSGASLDLSWSNSLAWTSCCCGPPHSSALHTTHYAPLNVLVCYPGPGLGSKGIIPLGSEGFLLSNILSPQLSSVCLGTMGHRLAKSWSSPVDMVRPGASF